MPSPHEWVRERLALALTETLPAEESQRFHDHLAECDSCRAMWSQLRSTGPSGRSIGSHIPVHVLQVWSEDPSRFQPLETKLVESHLSECAECREDLAELRNDAVAPAGATATTTVSLPARRPRRILDVAVGAGAGILATAAAIAIAWPFLQRQPALSPSSPPVAQRPAFPREISTTPPETVFAHASLASAPLTEFTMDLTRGGDSSRDSVLDVAIAMGDTAAYLRLEPAESDLSDAFHIRIIGPREDTNVDRTMPRSAFRGDRLFVYSHTGGLVMGLYHITLTSPGSVQPVQYVLRIRPRS